MTQEELDAIIASEGIIENIETETGSIDNNVEIVKQLESLVTESEEKSTIVFDLLEKVLSTVDQFQNNFDNKDDNLLNIESTVHEIMSELQYHDIHRQKIERVINTMNNELGIKSTNIAPSAKHIAGDENNDLVDEKDIEELISKNT